MAQRTTTKKDAPTKAAAKPVAKSTRADAPKRRLGLKRPNIKTPRFLRPITGYFAGAWYELRQVRWPNRRATWGLTLAVIFFSLFFAVLILSLDTVFNYLFKEVLL